ncbi:MAG: hypothetical protein OXT69_00040 [Candidatus Poribacteria bacterium]|nr:hypothetical protein [Candidatus Poribacteria bacterium]
MAKYWVIAPAEYSSSGSKADWYDTCWQYDHANGVIAIGWNLEEAPESPEHLRRLWAERADPAWSERGRRMVERFYFEIEDGDFVVARAGLLKYAGLGEFQGDAYYEEEASDQTWGGNLRKVRWQPDRSLRRSPVRFSQPTLYQLSPEKARLFNW